MRSHRYFLLYRDGPRVRADDGSHLMQDGGFPGSFPRAGRTYQRASEDDLRWFWDELHDERGATVGFALPAPEREPLLRPLIDDAVNVAIVAGDAWVVLGEGGRPVWECVQAFNCVVYRSVSGPPEALLLMLDYSENRLAFGLGPVSCGAEVADVKRGAMRTSSGAPGDRAHPLWDAEMDARAVAPYCNR
jgi:hypothetical protein